MTTIDTASIPGTDTIDQGLVALRPVAVDLYRDIHKGIRSELFAVTGRAGNLDPASDPDRADLARHVGDVVDLLVTHAEHEDDHVDDALQVHLPALAEQINADHEVLEARLVVLRDQADAAASLSATADRRLAMHQLHLDLADFTSAYLRHQDLEERIVMPALQDAIGVETVLGIHTAIVSSIPPEQMATSLALMIPAMNVDDRAELLGGMQQGAPPEVFQGIWGLVGSVLAPHDVETLATRLEL